MIVDLIIITLIILAAFWVLGLIYDRNWSKGLSVELSFAHREVREGDSTHLTEVIVNRKRLPLSSVEIDFSLDRGLRFQEQENSIVSDKLYRRDVFALAPSQRITRSLPVSCTKRGYYRLEGNGLVAKDIFLRKKYVTSFPQDARLYVFPERISAERLSVPFKHIMGELLTRERLYEDPFEFGGIRDYSPSDPMKYVNWKASAKTNELLVNFHDSTLSKKICLLLDVSGSSSAMESELDEEAIRIAAALSEELTAAAMSLDIKSNGRDVINGETLSITGLDTGGILSLHRALARLESKNTLSMAELMASEPQNSSCLYILLSKNRDGELAEALARLSGSSRSLWVCPYDGEFEALPVDTGRIQLIPWAADERKAGKGRGL